MTPCDSPTVWILSVKDREFDAILGVYASVEGAQAAEQSWLASHQGPYNPSDRGPHKWPRSWRAGKKAPLPWCATCDLTPYIEQLEVKP